jgi:hypothetical protein
MFYGSIMVNVFKRFALCTVWASSWWGNLHCTSETAISPHAPDYLHQEDNSEKVEVSPGYLVSRQYANRYVYLFDELTRRGLSTNQVLAFRDLIEQSRKKTPTESEKEKHEDFMTRAQQFRLDERAYEHTGPTHEILKKSYFAL